MNIHIREGDIHLLDIQTRMPFKYGIATMTRTPHAFVRLRVEIDGKLSTGIAADHLPPKWFTKDPTRALADEVAEMLRVIDHARAAAAGLRGTSAFDVWRQLWDVQAAWGREQELPPLLAHFGTSLVERALIEAVCRAAGQPFARMLLSNQLGIRLGEIHPSLEGKEPADLLPDRPRSWVIARHTVGLADPLTDADIAPEEKLDDALPQSLAACIRTYGLRHFKIKLSGQTDRDLDRLAGITKVIQEGAVRDCAFSLDGNEQFHSLAQFQDFWEQLRRSAALQSSAGRLLFVEQPFHRAVALEPAVLGPLAEWYTRPLMIIDESDAELDSLPRALQLGYAGTSHKNCKGVFKGIANACLLSQPLGLRVGVLSGEDLANIGPVALLQDLAVCACLGIESIERNGHHYFAGLSMFPPEVQRQVLAVHGDLYRPSRDGWPTLAIEYGELPIASVMKAPFGVGFELDVERFTPRESYRTV